MKSCKISLEELSWVNLRVPLAQLNCINTLVQGQCFNWFKLADTKDSTWVGVIAGQAIAFKQGEGDDSTYYARLLGGNTASECLTDEELDAFVRTYLQLDSDLHALYAQWSAACPRMASVTAALPGVRVLRQDPWECLLSFICSSNNNIKRITQMLDRLKLHYGTYVCSVVPRHAQPGEYEVTKLDVSDFKRQLDAPTSANDSGALLTEQLVAGSKRRRDAAGPGPGSPAAAAAVVNNNNGASSAVHLYSFPSIESLAEAEEQHLRALGMGYRAKFLRGTAVAVRALGGENWLHQLRLRGGREEQRLCVNEDLQKLPGVGRKVADCVALFSLDQTATVPVDVHVYDIAARDYDPSLLDSSKSSATGQIASLTPKLYERVGDLFRARFGKHAGWAHSVLFAAELDPFRKQLSSEMQTEMDEFDAKQRVMKKARADAKKEAKKKQAEEQGKEESEEVH